MKQMMMENICTDEPDNHIIMAFIGILLLGPRAVSHAFCCETQASESKEREG
jgi:hypothetical protein